MTKSVYTTRYSKLRRRLVEARESAGMSQRELARKLGRSQTFVSNYERGQRRLDLIELIEIADVLRLDVSTLARDVQGSAVDGDRVSAR